MQYNEKLIKKMITLYNKIMLRIRYFIITWTCMVMFNLYNDVIVVKELLNPLGLNALEIKNNLTLKWQKIISPNPNPNIGL